MTLKIYGISASRAIRPLWAAQELGVSYEWLPVPLGAGATRTPQFLAINPNGHIPVIDDAGLIVWESMACVLYLARRYGSAQPLGIAPQNMAEEAQALRWSFWAVNELERDALTVLAQRGSPAGQTALERLQPVLRVLEQHLSASPYLAGERFTVADLCVAAVMLWLRAGGAPLELVPCTQHWLNDCLSRPAYKQAKSLKSKS